MKNKRKILIGLCAVVMVLFLCMPAVAEKNVTITGTVTGGYQIEDENGQLYEIGDNEKGEELAQLVDSKVTVKGTLEEEDDMKIIMVTSFTVLDE